MMNILSFKLHRPEAPQVSVRSQAIIQRLDEGLHGGRPVTLVSAPAGFGKTTCICEWLPSVPLPVAWISLDADDNDPLRFFRYLIAALTQVSVTMGGSAFENLSKVDGILRAGQLPPPEVIAAALIADLGAFPPGRRFVLALDDFHLIQEPSILRVFQKLIIGLFQNRLIQPLHLVLLTREDPALPLARLRASNGITEIRAEDLRLNQTEAGRFLKDALGLSLSHEDVAALGERTEGWIAGLQLAGLSLRGRSDPSTFVQKLSGSHPHILSYLTEEVLNHQTGEVQQFLLDTSILDRLSGDLCDAVTGRADSANLLEQLRKANLFIIALDDEQRWYRYHHLFADLLRSRQKALQEERTVGLHQRASQWFACASADSERARGSFSERVGLVSGAVEHALAAGDYAAAVNLIEAYAMDIIGLWYARVLEGWLKALPQEWSSRSPRVNLIFARHYLMHNNFPQAGIYLANLQAIFTPPPGEPTPDVEPAVLADWLALQSTMISVQGNPVQALSLAQEALRIAPPRDLETRGHIYIALASSYDQLGDTANALEAYQTLIRLGRESSDLIVELLGISAMALLLIQQGKLRHGFALAQQGIERVEQSGELPPLSGSIYGELGQVCIHWNQLDEAERYFQRAVQVMDLVGFSDIGIYNAVIHSRLALVRGNIAQAAEDIQKAVSLMRADAPAVVREEVIAQQVQVLIATGDISTAEFILTNETHAGGLADLLAALDGMANIPYPKCVLYNSALRILLARGRGGSGSPAALKDGLALAQKLLSLLRQRGYVPHIIESLLLRVQIHHALGMQPECLDDLHAAVELAEPEGYISHFLQEGEPIRQALDALLRQTGAGTSRGLFLRKVLAAFPRPSGGVPDNQGKPVVRVGLVEMLTSREVEVLRLMVESLTYEEIAARLVVSINTVRSHVKAIYGKLGVNNRTAAIAAAEQQQIL